MNTGQTNFNGAKLKEAREARGITITGLSDLLGVSRQSITQYEKDEQNPKMEILEKISLILNLPKHFFLAPSEEEENNLIFYRSLSRTNQMERKSTEQKLKWFREIINYLQNYFEFISPNIPEFDVSSNIRNITHKEIELISQEARKFFNIGNGAISNLATLLENNGIIINRGEFNSNSIDAFSVWTKNSIPIIVQSSDKECAVRSRFDLAHELGHLIMHRKINEKVFSMNLKYIENQADYFAGAFMMPADSFTKDFYYPTLDVFTSLKEKWKMSIASMIIRTRDLNILNEIQVQRMWINYSRKGMKGKEPLDDIIEPEEPQFIKRCFEILINKDIQNRYDMELNLPYNLRDIEILSNLPEGFLQKNTKDSSSITPKIKTEVAPIFHINSSKNSYTN